MNDQTFQVTARSSTDQYHTEETTSPQVSVVDGEDPFGKVSTAEEANNDDSIEIGESNIYDVACEDPRTVEDNFSLSLTEEE